MADENYKRKLTATLSADVVGYSRLMGGACCDPRDHCDADTNLIAPDQLTERQG